MLHKNLSGTQVHTPITWTYADAAARTAATGFTADDVDKMALQSDDNSLWLLTATTPTWAPVSKGAVALNDLSDVSTAGATNGQVLGYSAGSWAPTTVSGGGGTATASVRQTVSQGAVDASGYPNFLSPGTGLAVDLAATATPVEIAFAAGFNSGPVDYFGRITADQVGFWSGLTDNATNYLFYDRNTSTGTITGVASTFAPVYQAYPPVSVVTPTMTAATSGGATASASSEFSTSYAAWKAFDGNTSSTNWASSSGSFPQWLKIDLGSAQTVGSFTVYGNPSTPGTNIKDFVLQGSNTGAFAGEEVALYTGSETGWSTSVTSFTYTIASPGSYRYYRVYITSNNGYATETDIWELKLWGTAPNGQRWFDLSSKTTKVGNGITWDTVQQVAAGECVTSAGAVTSVITYALNCRYDSGWFAVAAAVNYTKNHNCGIAIPDGLVVNYYYSLSGNNSDAADARYYYTAGGWEGIQNRDTAPTNDTRNTVWFGFGNYVQHYRGASRTSGYFRIIISRAW